MIHIKTEMGYTNEMIAKEAGVPLGTVQKIFAGITKAPRFGTLRALEDFFLRSPLPEPAEGSPAHLASKAFRQNIVGEPFSTASGGSLLREEAPAYGGDPRQGRYTIDDYYALPDDRRAELIDGYLYDMAAPTAVHQLILLQLSFQLYPCIERHPACELMIAPFDVRLDNDDRTMVQPDLMITCKTAQLDKRRFNGAPDLVMEILSPSNRFHDMFRKLNKYRSAGVREYWIVDAERLKVTVYDFERDELPETYSFSETVPVRISEGDCVIDLEKIRKKIAKYQ